MNRENDFDLRLARWLEEGPFEAPDGPMLAAIQHARAHPHRRFSRAALWRRAMDRLHLTPVTPHGRHLGWAFATALAAVAIVAVAVIGYTGLRFGGSSNVPAGGVVASPSPTPVPTPVRSPIAVSGTQVCGTKDHGTETKVGDVVQTRGEVQICTSRMSDPRVSGEVTVTVNYDHFADGTWNYWGTSLVVGPDGTWSGVWTANATDEDTVMPVNSVAVGSGGYAGLQYRATTYLAAGGPYEVKGTIEPVGPVAVTGTSDCDTKSGGSSVTRSEGIDHYRDVLLECANTASDPRVAGTDSVNMNIDMRLDDKSATLWGTAVLRNDGGTWEGSETGTVDKGYTTHRIEGIASGTGLYEGFQWRYRLTGPADGPYQITGTIEPIE